MRGQIFISYRRDDSAAWAGRLYDRFSIHFDSKHIFMDVDLDAGIDFVEAIAESVGSCDVLIAVVGKRWLIATDEDGSLRLNNPNDFVRTEIVTALKRRIRVIPVLVDGASMPRPHELPDELRSLARRNALEVSHNRFNADSERLINAIKRVLAVTTEHRESEPSDHLSIGADTGPTFTGLTFEEMCELLKREETNLDGLSPETVSGIKDCVMQFNDSKPGLLHVLWYYRIALQKGVRDNPEAERLSRFGLVLFDRRTRYVLTDDGKRFILLVKVRTANRSDRTTPGKSDHSIEHEPIFTGLTFEEMCETLRAEDIDLDELSSGTVSGIKDCAMQFNDSKPSLLHVLWHFQNILWGGDRKNPEASEASSLFDRLSGIAALVILHPTAGYSLTDDGKRFLLRLRYSKHLRS